jgi:glycosyltransferase involved in cell wall biosynthesis
MEIDKSLIATDKPLVSILLAVYKPNETWLIEQLISLNEQTYENIELLVYDDCPNYPVKEYTIKQYITKFSYTLIRGSENKGSNKAFEELTKQGNGDFFAYCDQDDIWESEKIEFLIDLIKKENAVLGYSDMFIIVSMESLQLKL